MNFWVFALIAGIFLLVFLVARNIHQESYQQTSAITEHIIRESLTQGWQAKVRSLAAMYADQLIQPVHAKDLEAIRHLAMVVKEHGLVTAIFVVDDQGIVLSDGTWQSLHLGEPFSRSLLPDRKGTLLVETPVRVGSHLIGKVIMQFDTHQTEYVITTLHTRAAGLFQQFQAAGQTRLALLFIASLLSGLAGAYALSRSLTRPLVLLSRATERLGRGEYTVPAPLAGDDEFGELAQTLKRVANSLRQNTVSKTYLKRILESLPVGVAVTDQRGFILNANTSLRHLCKLQEVPGRRLQEVIGVTPEIFRDVAELLSQGNSIRDKEVVLNLNGRLVDALLSGVPVEDLIDGAALNYLFIIYDITERKDLERQLRHLATHDHLTGLPNRRHLFNRIEEALAAYRSDQTHAFWLVFVDVDRFKRINDTYGHHVGDEVLKIVAKRLTAASRERDLVARLSGDEFLVMLRDNLDKNQALQIAQRFLETLRRPLHMQQLELTVSASVGLARSEPRHRCADDMVNAADTAMYQAKTQGKDQLITSFDGRRYASAQEAEQDDAHSLRHRLQSEHGSRCAGDRKRLPGAGGTQSRD
jgi:diguanylate cyclase (GGDEF)-like protein/PAS domain S-box-containing protein